MIIHSKFHDYYDISAGYGVDTTLHWSRVTTYQQGVNLPFGFPRGIIFPEPLTPYFVMFCGKLYKFFKDSIQKPITSYDDFDKYLVEMNPKYYRRNVRFCKDFFDKFVNEKILVDIHHQYKSPIILVSPVVQHTPQRYNKNIQKGILCKRGNLVTINPCLKDFGFQTIVDPHTAFQEISSFVGGVLGVCQQKTVEISDDDMKIKKGFNDKSFKHRT